jgi:glycosyltransferase involved in cell wall biosynthesis
VISLALCIPAYNAEKFLPTLLNSANDQIIPFSEILVYNDCSTDDTELVAKAHGARVINGDVNRGCSFGKNIMAKTSSCEWLHFHDADDDLLPDFTTKVHQWIREYGDMFQVLLLNFKYVDFGTGKLLGIANHNADELHHDALQYAINNKIVNFGVYNREVFLKAGGFDLDERVLYNEDNALHQRLAKAGLRFDYLPDIICINYRYSVSMSISNHLKCARSNYHVLANTAESHGEKYPLELSRQIWNCIASLAAAQDWTYVKMALALTRSLGYKASPEGNTSFKNLTQLNPFFAVWLREKMIRTFKPRFRSNG